MDRIRYVRTTPGNKVHYKFVEEWFDELRDEFDIYIPWHGYDAWSAEYYVESMKDKHGSESMIKVYQGKNFIRTNGKFRCRFKENTLIIITIQ